MTRRDLIALQPLAAVFALLALALGTIALLLNLGVYQFIVPSPKDEAEQFMRALKAHNYEAASDRLSEEAQAQVKTEGLQVAVKALEESKGGIEDAHGTKEEEQGEEATAVATVKLADNSEHELEFPLQRENGLWKLTSVESLLALAGQ